MNHRVLFVTVGTSAAENEELIECSSTLANRVGDSKIRHLIKGFEESRDQLQEIENLLLAVHRDFWDRGRNHREDVTKFKQTSAEMTSTYTAIMSESLGTGSLLQRGHDRVVMLLSNTPIGQMCGRINAKLFRDYLFFGKQPEETDVILETIGDLNPENDHPEKFRILDEVREIIDKHVDKNSGEVFFNITGSFKGVIPPITYLASSGPLATRSRILYMHESMQTTVTFQFGAIAGPHAPAHLMTELRRRTIANIKR